MGKEAICSVAWNGQVSEGRAQLEMPHLLFRGAFRLKIPVEGAAVEVKRGALRIPHDGSIAEFRLGDQADKWAGAILHPKTRLEKMGLKPGERVRIHGRAPADFLAELRAGGIERVARGPAGHAVFFVARRADLSALVDVDPPVWLIYPKAAAAVSQTEVLDAGRAMGWKDVKVCSFSTDKTGLRFTRPVARG